MTSSPALLSVLTSPVLLRIETCPTQCRYAHHPPASLAVQHAGRLETAAVDRYVLQQHEGVYVESERLAQAEQLGAVSRADFADTLPGSPGPDRLDDFGMESAVFEKIAVHVCPVISPP